MAAKTDSTPTTTQDTAFYTGKPYLASSGNYAFKYRSYSPELARWTSEDPSGFPNGANGNIYAPHPTSEFDSKGLDTESIDQTFSQTGWPDGEWKGAYVWTFAHNQEQAGTRVEVEGFSGFTGPALVFKNEVVDVGIGATLKAHVTNTSGYETKMVGGVQWKIWIVDLHVHFDKELVLVVPVYSKPVVYLDKHIEGNWYE